MEFKVYTTFSENYYIVVYMSLAFGIIVSHYTPSASK